MGGKGEIDFAFLFLLTGGDKLPVCTEVCRDNLRDQRVSANTAQPGSLQSIKIKARCESQPTWRLQRLLSPVLPLQLRRPQRFPETLSWQFALRQNEVVSCVGGSETSKSVVAFLMRDDCSWSHEITARGLGGQTEKVGKSPGEMSRLQDRPASGVGPGTCVWRVSG